MGRYCITGFLAIAAAAVCGCSSDHLENGWYPVDDSTSNRITGEALATVGDIEEVVMVRDTFVTAEDTVVQSLIQGRVKADKRKAWADGTERLTGHRLGFVFNDSVVTAPQINARIESGAFQINSSDTTLLMEIYNSMTQTTARQ